MKKSSRHIIGMEVRRSYTIASPSLESPEIDSTNGGVLHIMMKCYPQGALTPVLHDLKEGTNSMDSLSVSIQ